MAENKKSVLLYCDLIHTIEKLDDATAGQLFKHYLRYINDQNPTAQNPIVDIVFEPIKQTLKRDLKKWDKFIDKQSYNGKKGGRPKKTQTNPENPSLISETQTNPLKPKKAVRVRDSVKVIDSVIEKEIVSKVKPTALAPFLSWLEYRNSSTKPITNQKTLESLVKKFNLETPEKSNWVVEQSIQNGWRGLFWDKYIGTDKTKFANPTAGAI